MLVLKRAAGEKVVIKTTDGDIVVTVTHCSFDRFLRLGFEAPESVKILREELATKAKVGECGE